MEVILKEDIPKLGRMGDTVQVARGYGRNYLIPQGKALPATSKNLKALEHERRLIQGKAELVRKDAVLPAVMQQYAQVRSRLEALPEELAGSYPPEIRVDLISDSKHKIQLALRELETQAVPGAASE